MMLDWRVKGFWQPSPVPASSFLESRPSLFGGSFTWPVMVAKRSALDHNLATLASYCERHGFLFSPHGKTSMSPTLLSDQLKAGAWAITVATANQALICRNLGSFRLIIANEVLDHVALQWIATQPDILLYVDSLPSVTAAATAAASASAATASRTSPAASSAASRTLAAGADPAAAASVASIGGTAISVLVEVGYAGGRTGCRTLNEVKAVATAVAGAPGLSLAGIAGYEGGFTSPEDASSYVDFLRTAALDLVADGLLEPDAIVSAGGSTYFDIVATGLGTLAASGLQPVLRSGAYISHDHGFYQEHTPFLRVPHEGSLKPALEIWAQVTSTPEDGLVIAGIGKRDAPHDEGLPIPLVLRASDGSTRPADGFTVVKLNDHHAFVTAPREHGLIPGDLICFGISHPCTAFDKWRIIPVVDDSYVVTDVLETYF